MFLNKLVALVVLLICLVSANKEDRFSHAELRYTKGKYDELSAEAKKFFETELGNYKEIRVVEVETAGQPHLVFIE